MDDARLKFRKIHKVLAGGSSPDRNTQFERIAELIEQYQIAGHPCFSVDTKAKERLGKLFRAGRIRCSKAFQAFDHDFPSWADGVIIPHGIYDLARHRGHINTTALSRLVYNDTNDEFRMTNVERMSQARMTKRHNAHEKPTKCDFGFRHSVIPSSFGFRHSSFSLETLL